MTIAYRVQDYIAAYELPWDAVFHRTSGTSAESAHSAFIPEDHVAKAVLLRDEGGYVLAVFSADHYLDLEKFGVMLGRPLELASGRELRLLFPDCLPGAVPPVGQAYGIPTVWDDRLGALSDVWFEGGDHRTLVHMSGADFSELMRSARPLRRYIH